MLCSVGLGGELSLRAAKERRAAAASVQLPASPSQQGCPAGCRAPCLYLPGLNQQTNFLSVLIFFAGFHWNLAGFDIGAWCLLAWQTAKRKTLIREIPGLRFCG